MPESPDATYTRLLLNARDRVRALLAHILEDSTAGQGECAHCAATVQSAVAALTPPATWDDWVRAHGR
jgi:hypothetical protein